MLSVSIPRAIRQGFIMVYGLFLPFIVGVPLVVFLLTESLNLPDLLRILSVPFGILAAWIWWSYRVPQWRLWALQHVEDIDALHQQAVQVGIEWPYGHLFERTEIKSALHAQQEALLQLRYYLKRTNYLLQASLIDLEKNTFYQKYSGG